jgi:hypothetical protein
VAAVPNSYSKNNFRMQCHLEIMKGKYAYKVRNRAYLQEAALCLADKVVEAGYFFAAFGALHTL